MGTQDQWNPELSSYPFIRRGLLLQILIHNIEAKFPGLGFGSSQLSPHIGVRSLGKAVFWSGR
jgi:hypothetical protein